MQIAPEITFEGSYLSDAARVQILSEIERLETHSHRITGCRVIVSVRQASLQPITRVQRGMNGISRRVDRFRKKPPRTLRRSRHCSVTVRVNSRQFASGE